MRSLIIIIAILFFVGLVFAEEPKPFGLILGKNTENEVISILQKEGGRVIKTGYRIIKGDISNPNIKAIEFKGLPIENLTKARILFYQGTLFEIIYFFPISMNKDEFYLLYRQLESKYGKPIKYIKPWLADGLALWKFKDIEIKITAPWVSTEMYLNYTHLPLSKKADQSDNEILKQETSKPKKGF
ncbi:MAG: hypothetical protein QMD43_06575 [Thermodesulfovibrio sp.]|uniref:hypothetical protein n=1 Tax=Thermodesulfovibrio sp. N1 TaxID=1871110 RepID=UPI00083A43EC|nr:hypothetical protein [Thermodesulfovibrio sp. N1]MDI6714672.1 hypothetical protein [Thermodesulfovibrio sp.]ODA44121.1 hypothetical protein THER_1147 [Thermodesulfovibrio sp. N1]